MKRNSLFVLYAATMAVAGLLFVATPPHAQYPGYNNPGSYGPNKLRNSTMVSWFHGSSFTATTNWCGEGIWAVANTGGMSINRVTNDLAAPYAYSIHACELVGNAGITDITTRQVIESYDAASFVNTAVTCQWPIKNMAGSSITPTLTVKSGAAQDGTWTNVDVNGVALGTVVNNATAILTYTWTGSATSNNGLSLDIDFGNNFGVNTSKVHIGGGFNCRVTPGFPTGTGAASYIQQPDLIPAAEDINWNRRYYTTTRGNNTLIGQGDHTTVQCGIGYDYTNAVFKAIGFQFGTTMRATPTVTTNDGANNGTGKVSYNAGASWTDGVAATFTTAATTNGFVLTLTAGVGLTSTQACINYEADATLLGN